jgi:hypothetical protein
LEGVFLLLAMIATVLVAYWSYQNDRRPPGTPVTGLFAYRDGREPLPAERSKPIRVARDGRRPQRNARH